MYLADLPRLRYDGGVKLRTLLSGIVLASFAAVWAQEPAAAVKLPAPRKDSGVSLESVLAKRRSVRSFSDAPITLAQTGQLLWAAQGVTDAEGRRTAPSAMRTYPLTVYIAALRVEGLEAGIYKYRPADHSLDVVTRDKARETVLAAVKGPAAQGAALLVVMTTNYGGKMAKVPADLAHKWVDMESGFATQNLLLQAMALDLGAVVLGGVDHKALKQALRAGTEEELCCAVPVGKPR